MNPLSNGLTMSEVTRDTYQAIEGCFGNSTTLIGKFHELFLPQETPASGTPACAFLRQLRESGCQLDESSRDQLLAAIESVETSLDKLNVHGVDGSKHQNTISDRFGLTHPDSTQCDLLIQEFHHRLLGFLYAALAASSLPPQERIKGTSDDNSWVKWLDSCGIHFDHAWRFNFEETMTGQANGIVHPDRVDAALEHARDRGWLGGAKAGTWFIHATTWLTVRRILRFLLSHEDVTPPKQPDDVQTAMLTIVRRTDQRDDDEAKGRVRGLNLHACQEGRAGWYFDPVAWGITLFDDDMQQSIELAGRLAFPALRDRNDGRGAVRLMPAVYRTSSMQKTQPVRPEAPSTPARTTPGRCMLLSGNSAGGLAACALYALSKNETLTPGVTATVGMRPKKGVKLTLTKTITECDIELVPVGGIVHKLGAASQAGIIGVAVRHDNTADIHRFRLTPEARTCRVHTTESFTGLYDYLTKGYRIELALKDYARPAVAHWNAMLQGDPSGEFDHKLDTHVEPRLAVELRPEELRAQRKDQDRRSLDDERVPGHPDRFKLLDRGVDELISNYVHKEWSWLLISERAGGGKTVLSWQLRAKLSEGETPCLVVRYENNWPNNLLQSLQDAIRDPCKGRGVSPEEAVKWLLDERRVIVIFDALDQVDDETSEILTTLASYADDHPLSKKRLRIIVTSRPNAVERWSDGFSKEIWRHFHLEEFDDRQQAEYVEKFAQVRERIEPSQGERVRELWKTLTQMTTGDLLTLPNNLRHLREMIEEHLDRGEPLRPIATAGDLRWELAYRNLRLDPFKGQGKRRDLGIVGELMHAAACLAFELFRQTGTYIARGEAVKQVKTMAQQRYSASDADWKDYDRMLTDSLKLGSAVLRRNNTDEFSFPSQKTMEFFAGLYLARHADKQSLADLRPQIGDTKWDDAWVFAIEMLATTNAEGQPLFIPQAYQRSITALFDRPDEHPRPTKCMFFAWQIMKQNLFSGLQTILDGYRQQFLDILAGEDLERAQLASQLLFEEDVEHLVKRNHTGGRKLEDLRPGITLLRKKLRSTRGPLDPMILGKFSYSLCADLTARGEYQQTLSFLMGSHPDHNPRHSFEIEKPWKEITLPAFYMATCCVTRAQYRLFDVLHERQHHDIDTYAPSNDSPMLYMSLFDGLSFALWLGEKYRLPSECEWEGAAWGGIDRREHPDYVISVKPFVHTFTTSAVNHDGNCPLQGNKSLSIGQSLPVRWDTTRRKKERHKESRIRELPVFLPNGYGLWQMNGNVWEWSYEYNYDIKVIRQLMKGYRIGGIARGGSWDTDAKHCRNANKYLDGGDSDQGRRMGFRLAKTP